MNPNLPPSSTEASRPPAPHHAEPARFFPKNEYGFVVSFGIPLTCLAELHVYRGTGTIDQLPPKVAALLRKLYDQGNAIGPAIMALLHQGRHMGEGEAVYVAVVSNPSGQPKQIKTFIASDPG